MRRYDLIVIGSGSAMMIVDAMIGSKPDLKVAVIDKDDPGGICLTRGCIPSKILLYPAELIRTLDDAEELGLDIEIRRVDFQRIMERMRSLISKDIDIIREGLSNSKNIDYYHERAEFVAPYTMKVGDDVMSSSMIILCIGSKPIVPPIKGLEKINYHTSDTILRMERLPESIAIIGGGYIAAEYGHFFSAMGSAVTIIGRNPQLLPDEEPEISALAKRELGKRMKIITGYEVQEAQITADGQTKLVAVARGGLGTVEVIAREVLVATGRGSNADILHPERGGITTDREGWIVVDEYLQTSQPNVWALGDADGRYLFKHVANYEAKVVYYNAVLKRKMKVDYHAIPHAVFTHPEIASVGMTEKEALQTLGHDKVLIGIQRYQETAKGEAMAIRDCFVKVIVEGETTRIIGAHIIGPQASILIQEVINLMYTNGQTALPITEGMHIHPALSEVVERAFGSLMPIESYHHLIEHHYGLPAG